MIVKHKNNDFLQITKLFYTQKAGNPNYLFKVSSESLNCYLFKTIFWILLG
jgi:hypothetical protein